ncbi:MAG: hypothetical protein HC836_10730 [Richelia sp. RM2_1_2]|nr:hypothetical protein [Richelia sp. RM2_1_2]
MKKNLFKKVACFTDIHFGKGSNSEPYNKKCNKFVDWFIDEALSWGADTCIFLGDWHDSRISIQVKTLNYSLNCMEKLGTAFEKFYFIPGNHDIYHRTRRDYTSVEIGRNVSNLTIAKDPIVIDNVGLVPWLINDEWKSVKKMKCQYMFGHFELPSFIMNAQVEMPENSDGLDASDLSIPTYVFSGHFHKRQNKGNIWYIGNAFPQNFTDTNDIERGMMFLEWGGEPKFKAWPDQPIFKQYNLSEIVDEPDKYIGPNINARIIVDLEMTYEEAQYIREAFMNDYCAEEIKFIPKQSDAEDTKWEGEIKFQSVDQIVIEGLRNLDQSSTYDQSMLVEIYNDL